MGAIAAKLQINGIATPLGVGGLLIDRGYTGHEHLWEINLIHMNARLYDPVLHKFLGPDKYIQELDNSQNYNRYGYAWNNPLMYTDPDGNFIFTHFLIHYLEIEDSTYSIQKKTE